MRILQVEDDHATAQSVELMLKSKGFNVYTTGLGEEGIDLAKMYDYDLILHDINLPDMNGIDAVRQIRAAGVKTPIMMVTGSTAIERKTAAFAAGADDYLTKPFHKDELIARSHAIIRRSKGHAEAVINVGPIAVNLDAKTVEVGGRSVYLTGKEYRVLELMALRLGTTVTKDMLLNHLYGGMDEPEPKIIGVFICKLRKKLRDVDPTAAAHLGTIWGRGYRMSAEPGIYREQKTGVTTSCVGRILALLAKTPSVARSRRWIASALQVEMSLAYTSLKNLRDKSWVEIDGMRENSTWSITAGGIAENARRQAYATAA